MNTHDIVEFVEQYLRKLGADGLCNEVVECGCGIDDLMPCGEIDNLSNCEPAKRVKCTAECEHEGGPPYDCHFEPIGEKNHDNSKRHTRRVLGDKRDDARENPG